MGREDPIGSPSSLNLSMNTVGARIFRSRLPRAELTSEARLIAQARPCLRGVFKCNPGSRKSRSLLAAPEVVHSACAVLPAFRLNTHGYVFVMYSF